MRTARMLLPVIGLGMTLFLGACAGSTTSRSAFANAADAARFVRHQILSKHVCPGVTGRIQCRADGARWSCGGGSGPSLTIGPKDSGGHFSFSC